MALAMCLVATTKQQEVSLSKKCEFDVSSLIEQTNQNSGRYINKLGFYSSCKNQEDKVYYISQTYQLYGALTDVFMGFCTPSDCTNDDVTEVVKTVWGDVKYGGIAVDDVSKFEKTKFVTDFGGILFYTWFGISMGYAIYATIVNRSKVWKKKREQKRMRRLGLYESANARRRTRRITGTLEEKKKSTQPEMIQIWDMSRNLKTLLYPRRVNSAVQVFELLRVLAFFWVIFSHEFAYRLKVSQNYIDPSFLKYTETSWAFTVVENGFYAVDIFLFMGGYVSILATTKYINSFQGMGLKHSIPIYLFSILRRYIRIMPSYAIMMLFFWKVSFNFVSGPLSPSWFFCNQKNFWQSFILGWKSDITGTELCAGWCWYLAVDFQLYCTMPILIMIVRNKRRVGIAITTALVALCTILTVVVCYQKDLYWLNYYDNSMQKFYYSKSYLRGNIYYMGSLVAYLTMKGGKGKKGKKGKKKEEKKPKKEYTEEQKKKFKAKKKRKGRLMLLIIFLVCSTIMIVNTLILHFIFQWGRAKSNANHFSNVMFITFGKVAFIVSFLGILMPISFTFKAFGKFIADNRLIQLIGNISFTGYLFHFTVILMRMYGTEALPTYTFYDFLGCFCCDLFYSIILATLGSLLIEIPIQAMWRTRVEVHLMARLKKWVQDTKRKRSRSSSKISHARKSRRQSKISVVDIEKKKE